MYNHFITLLMLFICWRSVIIPSISMPTFNPEWTFPNLLMRNFVFPALQLKNMELCVKLCCPITDCFVRHAENPESLFRIINQQAQFAGR